MLFASDEVLTQMQQKAKRFPKGVEMPVADQLRTQIDDYRELREHQRWRDFAWLLHRTHLGRAAGGRAAVGCREACDMSRQYRPSARMAPNWSGPFPCPGADL